MRSNKQALNLVEDIEDMASDRLELSSDRFFKTLFQRPLLAYDIISENVREFDMLGC